MMRMEDRKISEAYMRMYGNGRMCESIGDIIKDTFGGRAKDDMAHGAESAQAVRNPEPTEPERNGHDAEKPFGKLELSLSNPEFSGLPSSVSSRIVKRLGRYARDGFEIYRQLSQSGGISSACAIKEGSEGMGDDVGVYAILQVVADGDVELVRSILSNFSSAGVLWIDSSNGASLEAIEYMDGKMRNFRTDGGKSIFFRRYMSDGDLTADEKSRISKLTS